MNDGNEELFESYLRTTATRRGGGSLSDSSISSYLATLEKLSRKLREEKITKESIFEIDDMKELLQLHEMLLHGKTTIAEQNIKQDHIYSAALFHYITMLSLQPEDDDFEEIVRPMEAFKEGAFDPSPSNEQDLADLFSKATENPKAENAISRLQIQRSRAHFVKSFTLARADDRCDLCGKTTFKMKNGHYFLECHHLVFLANNGLDSIINTVALCPNCHRMMHLGLKQERDESFEALLQIVYHYVQDEARFNQKMPSEFIDYFRPTHPEVASF